MRAVGVDPGQNGAAVVLNSRCDVIDVQVWRKAKSPPLLSIVRSGDVIAIERPHLQASPHTLAVLAQWCGEMIGQLPAGVTVLRPLATSWRAKVLRAGRMKRDVAKRLAVAAAGPYLREFADKGEYPPPWLPSDAAEISHDLAEAFLIARYAWGWAAAHPAEVEPG